MHRIFSFHLFLTSIVFLSFSSSLAAGAQKEAPSRQGQENFISNIRQQTLVGKRAGEGYFSPNGRLMIFQSERQPGNPFFQMYLMNRDTGDVHRISPGHGKTSCGSIHPLRPTALFASTQEDPRAKAKQKAEIARRKLGKKQRYRSDYDETYDLQEVDLTTGRYRNLTNMKGYDAEGSYSPDGRQIVFASNRTAYDHRLNAAEAAQFKKDKSTFMEIYIMDTDGKNIRRLTKTPGYDGGPFFSHDGRKIVWRRFAPDGRSAEIHTMNIDGSDQRQITRLGLISWAPFFHPSGDYIAYVSNRYGHRNFELFIIDVKGQGDPVRVTTFEGFDGFPVFTADGKSLSWTSKRGGAGSQIFMADWNDAKARAMLGLDARAAGNVEQSECSECKARISRLRWHMATLASDKMEGRLTGTRGERLATSYAADVFRLLGLKPAGDKGSFYQSFKFTSGVSLGKVNTLTISGKDYSFGPTLGENWRPLSFSKSGDVHKAPVIFAGYGIEAPKSKTQKSYNSYEDVDIKGKWVLMFRGVPGDIDGKTRLHLSRFASLQYKASAARARGAVGILVAPTPGVKYKDELVRLSFDAVGGTSSLGAVSISNRTFTRLIEPLGHGFKNMLKSLNGGARMRATEIPNIKIRSTTSITREQKTGRNVLARLVSKNKSAKPPLIIGAHIDHLGHGYVSGSLATGEEIGKVHFGADDNASGVSALLEIAERFAGLHKYGYLKPQRDIIFAAWSGEELGLIGSSHYIKKLQKQAGRKDLSPDVSAYLNMDMVGRLRQKLSLFGTGSSAVWPHIIERANIRAQLDLKLSTNSYVPTDASSFYLAGVPILHAYTGVHKDYSTPHDTVDKINYEGLAKITNFMETAALQLARSARSPDYKRQKRPTGHGVRRRSLVSLGTIPDYTAKGQKGLLLSGVTKDSAAEKAGLRAGDRIIRLAKKPIQNIYDYVRVINMLKAGKAVTVTVMRKKSRLGFILTPEPQE